MNKIAYFSFKIFFEQSLMQPQVPWLQAVPQHHCELRPTLTIVAYFAVQFTSYGHYLQTDKMMCAPSISLSL